MASTTFEKPMGAEVETLKGQIGTLSTLTTTNKQSTVSAINEINGKVTGLSITESATGTQSIPVNTRVAAPHYGNVWVKGGTNGTSVTIGEYTYSVPANIVQRFPVIKGDMTSYTGGPYSSCYFEYPVYTISVP